MDTEQQPFQLIFEGPADSSEDTLRHLKGVFLADLEFPIDEIMRILSSAPVAIKGAEDRESLESIEDLLRKAGGKVLIVGPAQDDEAASDLNEMTLELSFDPDESGTSRISGEDSDAEVESPEPKVYVIDEDADDLAAILNDAEACVADDAPVAESPSEMSLSFEESAAEFSVETGSVQLPDLSESLSLADTLPSSFETDAINAILAPLDQPGVAPDFNVPAEQPEPVQSESSVLTFDTPEQAQETLSEEPSPVARMAEESSEFSLASLSAGLTLALEDSHAEQSLHDSPLDGQAEEFPLDIAPPPAQNSPQGLHLEAADHTTPEPVEMKLVATVSEAPAAVSMVTEIETTAAPARPPPPAHPLSGKEILQKAKPGSSGADSPTGPATQVDPDAPKPIEMVPVIDRRSKLSKIPGSDVLLSSVLGSLILVIANWIYFSSDKPAAAPPAPEVIAADSVAERAITKREQMKQKREATSPDDAPVAAEKIYSATVSRHGGESTLTLTRAGSEILNASFSMSSAAPPEQSPEEIARKALEVPWMKKLEAGNFTFEKTGENSFTGTAQAKIYFKVGGRGERIVAPLVITGELLEIEGPQKVRYQVLRGQSELTEDESFRVWQSEPGEFGVAIGGVIEALEVQPTPAAEVGEAPKK